MIILLIDLWRAWINLTFTWAGLGSGGLDHAMTFVHDAPSVRHDRTTILLHWLTTGLVACNGWAV